MNAPDIHALRDARISAEADRLEQQVIAWRRHIHANPELGNREFETGKMVAAHLRKLGFDDVREKVAYTGVVGVLKGASRARAWRCAPTWMRSRSPKRPTCRSGAPCGRCGTA